MSNKQHIEEQWTNYSKVALRPDATAEEVAACKSSFFAGAHLGISVVLDAEDVEVVFREVKAEIATFVEAQKKAAQ